MADTTVQRKSLKEIIKDEYERCALDPVHFMRKYCKIQHPQRGKVPFHLYPFQADCLNQFKNHRYNIILKSRQLGISTLSAGYSLWMMTFHEDKNILVIATKQAVAKNLITKVRVMYDNLPSWLKVETEEHNKMSLRFTNGSNIKSESSKQDAGRSEALSLLVLDEAAFIDYAEEIWTAAQQTLATGGSCITLSTPNGVGNWFHRQWVDAEEGRNDFNTIRLRWQMHPDRDQDWRDEQTRILGAQQAAQECDGDFLSGGASVIPLETLQYYKQTYVKEPIEKRGIDQNLWLWEYPNPSTSYMVVADVARGDASDFSAFHVIDLENLVQIAEYKGKMDTKTFGNLLVETAVAHNDALLVVENANVGWTTIQQVINRNYPNLFYMSKDLKYIDIQKQLTNRFRSIDKNLVAGFSTTTKTRPLIIAKLHQYFLERELVIRSKRTISELETFIWKASKAEAMNGHNDDLVLSLSIGLWVRDTALLLKQRGIEITKSTLTQLDTSQGVYASDTTEVNPYIMHINEHEQEDLRQWL